MKFEPPAAVSTYRAQFYTRVQKPNETITDFCTALQQLAQKCNWGDHRDQALRDRLQSGVYNQSLKRKLMGMPDRTTFDEMRNLAIREETLDEQLAQQARMIPPINQVEVGYAYFSPTNHQYFGVHSNGQPQFQSTNYSQRFPFPRPFLPADPIQQGRFPNPTVWRRNQPVRTPRAQNPAVQAQVRFQQGAAAETPRPCFRCGRAASESHTPQTCPAKKSNCKKCGKVGHWKAQCRDISLLQAEFAELYLSTYQQPVAAAEIPTNIQSVQMSGNPAGANHSEEQVPQEDDTFINQLLYGEN